jgi:hypothetical protein
VPMWAYARFASTRADQPHLSLTPTASRAHGGTPGVPIGDHVLDNEWSLAPYSQRPTLSKRGARAVYPATVTSHDAPELVHVSGASARLAIGSLLVAGPGASGGGTFRSTGPTSSGYRGEPDSPTSGFR